MTTPPPKVIVLGCTQSGLQVMRSMGKRGAEILALTYNVDEPAMVSRYVTEWHEIPHPRNEQAFVNSLISYADEWQGALILETNDYYSTALSRNKDVLAEYYHLVVPDYDIALVFFEKDQTYQLADECGVNYPKIITPQTMQELNDVIDSVTFPVMLKPINSHEFIVIFKEKLFIVESESELRERFQQTLDAEQPVVISEIIPGSDYKTLERVQFYINSQGDTAAAFSNTKLRQTPPMFGVMRVGKSTPANEEAVELGHRLLHRLNYRGFASVEFKRDMRDGQLKLMEVNIRMPRSLRLPVKSGVDFPYIIYEDLVNDNQLTIPAYHENTYLIEILADISDFIKKDEDRHLGRFLQPYFASRKTFSYLHISDVRPFMKELRMRSKRFSKRNFV